jgi:hypothetical protein
MRATAENHFVPRREIPANRELEINLSPGGITTMNTTEVAQNNFNFGTVMTPTRLTPHTLKEGPTVRRA